MKKSLAALILFFLILSALGCTGSDGKKEPQISTNQAFSLLKGNLESLIQTNEAKENKSISKWHWNFLTEGVVNSSKRISKALENDPSEEAKILRDVAEKIVTLTSMYSEEINKGKPAEDAPSLLKEIQEDLDKVEEIIRNNQQ
ncbi:MAG: hypothetical protein GX088_05550 [Clostridia bacterium]|nr:hypothetical protein [Clostridia bacterium]